MSLSSPVPPSCPLRRIPTGMEPAQPAAVVGTVPAAEALSGFPFLQAVSAVRHHTMSRSRSAWYGFGFVIGHPLFLGGGVRTIPNPMPKRPGRDLTSPGHGDTVFSRVRPAYGMVLLYKRHFRGPLCSPNAIRCPSRRRVQSLCVHKTNRCRRCRYTHRRFSLALCVQIPRAKRFRSP